jgi:hypothetical protein
VHRGRKGPSIVCLRKRQRIARTSRRWSMESETIGRVACLFRRAAGRVSRPPPRAVREPTQVCERADGSECTAACDRSMSAPSTSGTVGRRRGVVLLLVGLVGSVLVRIALYRANIRPWPSRCSTPPVSRSRQGPVSAAWFDREPLCLPRGVGHKGSTRDAFSAAHRPRPSRRPRRPADLRSKTSGIRHSVDAFSLHSARAQHDFGGPGRSATPAAHQTVVRGIPMQLPAVSPMAAHRPMPGSGRVPTSRAEIA